jgi:hypothetical protein
MDDEPSWVADIEPEADREAVRAVLARRRWYHAHPHEPMPDIDIIITAMTQLEASRNDCCGNDSWRGRYCQFHSGFADGMYAMYERLRLEGRLK